MYRILAFSAALTFAPGLAGADTVVIVEPEVETWIMEQPGPVVTLEEEVEVGDVIPNTVEVIEVPEYDEYDYAVINGRRTVIDGMTGEVIAIY
jgi:hypothetical protein